MNWSVSRFHLFADAAVDERCTMILGTLTSVSTFRERHLTATLPPMAKRYCAPLGIDDRVNDRERPMRGPRKDKCYLYTLFSWPPRTIRPRLWRRKAINFLCRPKRSKVQDTKRRYDIHLSSSASKIVNYRAHHHGTMLISTRLDMLGDLRVKGKVRHYDRIPCFRIPGAHMARRSWSPRTRRVAHGPRQKWMLVRRNQPQLASGRYPVSAR
ncbi:hypothetical protein DFP72DRAFT_552026 [Ephemerocybe angulata]|uniref:Uncharacterized protein n=1 Tax=Ephemerocybe angulata TaxID=980116 RepID=A0A8H6LZR1_9AGAR|nr:hypothetical protein DFP72DRAFT_552026 [Tulosesus angulatus]